MQSFKENLYKNKIIVDFISIFPLPYIKISFQIT